MKKNENIGIFGSHISWNGGVDFLCYMVEGLLVANPTIKIHLVIPIPLIGRIKSMVLKLINTKGPLEMLKVILSKGSYQNKGAAIIKAFDDKGFSYKKVYYNYTKADLIRKIEANAIGLIFPSMKSLGFEADLNWVGYIPDLQHKHLPENFSKKEIELRDKRYSQLRDDSKLLIVNSNAAKNDLVKYYGIFNNILTLPFSPPKPQFNFSDEDISGTKKKFGITKRYFIVSNQFWRHKDHAVAIKALKGLNSDVDLVLTGKPYDDKDPGFIDEIYALIESLELSGRVHFVGFVSKTDQLCLLKGSVCLVQPTLFEGGPGGGAVYNAISYGVRCIVSDIDINKEIIYDHLLFFETGKEASLRAAMNEVLNTPELQMPFDKLCDLGDARTKDLGESMFNDFSKVVV